MKTDDQSTATCPYCSRESSCEASAKYRYVISPVIPTPIESRLARRP